MASSTVADMIQELSGLLSPQKENPKKLASLLMRIQNVLHRLHDSSSSLFDSSPLQSLLHDLLHLRNSVDSYLSKSDLYQIVHCREFNDVLTLISRAIAKWLSAIAMSVKDSSDLSQELRELSSELELIDLEATDMECRICAAIDEELRNGTRRTRNDSLMAQIAGELGIGSPDYASQLSSRIELYKNEVQESPRDRQIAELLRNFIENSRHAEDPTGSSGIEVVIIEEEQPFAPFQSFICPLSREVMVEPVILLETQQTYDRTGIEHWFQRCSEEGKPPTCPTTGKILQSTEWRRNFILQSTILEWLDRNFQRRISTATKKLSSSSIVDYEEAVEEVRRISEESSKHRCDLRNAGIIPLLVEPWKRLSLHEHDLRSKVLVALRSMAMDNKDNKLEMVNEDVIRYAVKSLMSTEDVEKECAAQLLKELSLEPEICVKISTQKGAILLLDDLTCSGENQNVQHLAKHILANLEREPSTVMAMAEGGRLQPLLDLLTEGLPGVKLKMAGHLSRLTLSKNDKEMVTIRAGKVLIGMLYSEIADKSVAIRTLLMLSDLVDNGVLLVEYGILQPLFSFINSKDYISHIPVVEDAVKVLANVIAKPGHWEEAIVTENGDTLQSEDVVHRILSLMTRVGFKWKHSMLRLLYSIASSPKASDAALLHIQSGNGIGLLSFIVQEESENRKLALKILAILSKSSSLEVAEKLKENELYSHLMKLLKGSDLEEQDAAACILADTVLTEKDFLEMLSLQVIPWIVEQLKNAWKDNSSHAKQNAVRDMREGLLRLLLRFCMASDSRVRRTLKEQNIMNVLKEFLCRPSHPSLRKMAADGLRILPERNSAPADMDPPASWRSCCFAFLYQNKNLAKDLCTLHGNACQSPTAFCIIQADVVKPLVELLDDSDESVRLASICTLSTLLQDEDSLKAGIDELVKENGISRIIKLFCSGKPGQLQDQLVFIIERITHVNDISQKYAMDPVLTKTLVQAFKTAGSPATKTRAQTALTNLKQLSGMVATRK